MYATMMSTTMINNTIMCGGILTTLESVTRGSQKLGRFHAMMEKCDEACQHYMQQICVRRHSIWRHILLKAQECGTKNMELALFKGGTCKLTYIAQQSKSFLPRVNNKKKKYFGLSQNCIVKRLKMDQAKHRKWLFELELIQVSSEVALEEN